MGTTTFSTVSRLHTDLCTRNSCFSPISTNLSFYTWEHRSFLIHTNESSITSAFSFKSVHLQQTFRPKFQQHCNLKTELGQPSFYAREILVSISHNPRKMLIIAFLWELEVFWLDQFSVYIVVAVKNFFKQVDLRMIF